MCPAASVCYTGNSNRFKEQQGKNYLSDKDNSEPCLNECFLYITNVKV